MANKKKNESVMEKVKHGLGMDSSSSKSSKNKSSKSKSTSSKSTSNKSDDGRRSNKSK